MVDLFWHNGDYIKIARGGKREKAWPEKWKARNGSYRHLSFVPVE